MRERFAVGLLLSLNRPMTFLENYQKQAHNGLFVLPGTDKLLHCALGIAGEAGEIADAVKKSQYDNPRPLNTQALALELGDVLWYVTNAATEIRYSLETIIALNVSKLVERHSSRNVYSIAELYAGSR